MDWDNTLFPTFHLENRGMINRTFDLLPEGLAHDLKLLESSAVYSIDSDRDSRASFVHISVCVHCHQLGAWMASKVLRYVHASFGRHHQNERSENCQRKRRLPVSFSKPADHLESQDISVALPARPSRRVVEVCQSACRRRQRLRAAGREPSCGCLESDLKTSQGSEGIAERHGQMPCSTAIGFEGHGPLGKASQRGAAMQHRRPLNRLLIS